MRIVRHDANRHWVPIHAIVAGASVEFKYAFHQDCKPGDIFIVNEVCMSYRPGDYHYAAKIPVTNLRTGKLSYVDKGRQAAVVSSEVVLDE